MTFTSRPVDERFDEKVRRSSGCWVWLAHRNAHGYGTFWNGERTILAHRFSYERSKGTIAEGLFVDHICRNRACVNPDHLRLLTNVENVMEENSHAAGLTNSRKTRCPQGHEYTVRTVHRTRTDGRPQQERVCLICHRDGQRRRYRAFHTATHEKTPKEGRE